MPQAQGYQFWPLCIVSSQNVTFCVFEKWWFQGDYGLLCTRINRSAPPPMSMGYGTKLDMLNYNATSPGTLFLGSVQSFKLLRDIVCFFKIVVSRGLWVVLH